MIDHEFVEAECCGHVSIEDELGPQHSDLRPMPKTRSIKVKLMTQVLVSKPMFIEARPRTSPLVPESSVPRLRSIEAGFGTLAPMPELIEA